MHRFAAALALVFGLTLAATAATRSGDTSASTLDDPAIVAIFDFANTADIETGQLAAQRGQSKDVREFGAMLAQVHTIVRQNGRDLAKKLGVTPALPKGDRSAQDHSAVMASLQKLSGTAFDRAFLEHEEVFHANVITAVKTALLPAIQNKELKDFVTQLAPAFEAHRQAAVNIQKKLVTSQ